MSKLLFALLFALAAIIAVVIIRALLFKAAPYAEKDYEKEDIDEYKAINDLAELVRCKTVSNKASELEDEAEFDKLKTLLPRLFPNIYKSCEFTKLGNRALLYRFKGKKSDSPTVLMAHFDVVSVEENNWEKPPFDGIIENGYLWGRGTLDTKITMNAAMQALETLIPTGFIPENDIYLAFSGNEEVNGSGAPMIVNLFEERGIRPGVVLDEGGAVVRNAFPGVKAPCALIGIAEKGMLNVELSYKGTGGHSSSPKPHTPIGILSKACVKIENKPFKFRICDASYSMFNTLARHSSFVYRIIFANLWLFKPLLSTISKKSGGELNALMRTTCAFTQMVGSKGINVIPSEAKMMANLRILPAETTESALNHLIKTVNNKEISITKIDGMNPSITSKTDTEQYSLLADAISCIWTNSIVSPYLMFACSDSRYWGRICDRVYRFSPMELSTEQRALIHGNNERVPLETITKAVEFYIKFIKKC